MQACHNFFNFSDWIPTTWILDHNGWIPDSISWIPDSRAVDSGFHRPKLPGFRIPDYLTWGDFPLTFQNYGWRNGAKFTSLYSFTFNALIDIHEYIYSHSTTEFTFKKYIYSHLPVYFLFTIIFAHIYEMSSFTFNESYPFTFTIEIFMMFVSGFNIEVSF